MIGDRWTLLVVAALMQGPRRWGELMADIAGIAPNVLSQRLKHLEREGLVVAEAYSARPRRFVYDLTAPGRELSGPLRLLAQWGAGRDGAGEPLRHEDCGTPMEARWYCPTCARVVEDEEATAVRFV